MLACLAVPTDCELACAAMSECELPLVGTPEDCAAFNCPDGRPSALFAGAVPCALEHLVSGQCDEEAHTECVLGFAFP